MEIIRTAAWLLPQIPGRQGLKMASSIVCARDDTTWAGLLLQGNIRLQPRSPSSWAQGLQELQGSLVPNASAASGMGKDYQGLVLTNIYFKKSKISLDSGFISTDRMAASVYLVAFLLSLLPPSLARRIFFNIGVTQLWERAVVKAIPWPLG